MAQSGSSGALLAKANVISVSTDLVSRFGTTSGSAAPLSFFSTVASDCPSTVPPAHVTSITRIASMHWPNVSARIATP